MSSPPPPLLQPGHSLATAAGIPVPGGGRNGDTQVEADGVGCRCHAGGCPRAEGLCSPSSERSLGSSPFSAVTAQEG